MIARDDPVEARSNRNPPPVALNLKQNRPSTTRTVKRVDIRDGEKLLLRTGSLPVTPNERSHRSPPSMEDERQVLMKHEPGSGQDAPGQRRKEAKGSSSANACSNSTMSSLSRESGSEYVNLEDLAPLAMDRIEALSLKGLRIQSGMSDEEAPSNISPQAMGDISALTGKRANINGSLSLEGAGG